LGSLYIWHFHFEGKFYILHFDLKLQKIRFFGLFTFGISVFWSVGILHCQIHIVSEMPGYPPRYEPTPQSLTPRECHPGKCKQSTLRHWGRKVSVAP
jgi:hypothetical protein